MASVGAAVVADDEIVLIGEQIDDFALGLIAPLQSDDTSGRHDWKPLFRPSRLPRRGQGPNMKELCRSEYQSRKRKRRYHHVRRLRFRLCWSFTRRLRRPY